MPISGGSGRGTILTPYYSDALLPAATNFIPASGTIIFVAHLFASPQDLDLVNPGPGNIIKAGADMGVTEEGWHGATLFYVSSAALGYRNTDGVQHALILQGLTIG